MNHLQEPLYQLFSRLNFLNFAIQDTQNHFKQLSQTAQKHFNENSTWREEQQRTVHATGLVVRDLTEWHPDGWARTYKTNVYVVKGDKYFQNLDELLAIQAGWTVSQAYEAFETYLYDITTKLAEIKPDVLDDQKLEKLKLAHDVSAGYMYYKEVVRKLFRDKANKKVFSFLRNNSSGLREAEEGKNNQGINLYDWCVAVTKVRHAVTHASQIVKPDEFKELSCKQHDVLKEYFPGTYKEDEGYSLKLSVESAEEAVRMFAEYAYLILKCLSIKHGYEWKVMPGQEK